jgi:hypothetical protein
MVTDVLDAILNRSSATKLVDPAPDRAQLETMLRAVWRRFDQPGRGAAVEDRVEDVGDHGGRGAPMRRVSRPPAR